MQMVGDSGHSCSSDIYRLTGPTYKQLYPPTVVSAYYTFIARGDVVAQWRIHGGSIEVMWCLNGGDVVDQCKKCGGSMEEMWSINLMRWGGSI